MENGTGNIKQQSEHDNNLYVNTILNKTKTKKDNLQKCNCQKASYPCDVQSDLIFKTIIQVLFLYSHDYLMAGFLE